MTPSLWERFREVIGLPGKTRVIEIPNYKLARHFFSTERKKAGNCAPGQKQKEVRPC
jgi:hypothetical protein